MSAVMYFVAEQRKKQLVHRKKQKKQFKIQGKGNRVIVRLSSVLNRKIPFKSKLEQTLALMIKDEKHSQIREDWKKRSRCASFLF